MEQITVKAKRWGNSLGIILPRILVEKERIKEGSEVVIQVRTSKGTTGGDLMELSRKLGIDRNLKGIDTQKAIKNANEALWPE
jgi:antitoxin component of MazEF toxin-antitoxin module